MKTRLERAALEMAEAPWYDYLIVNDELDWATEELAAVIKANRCRTVAVLPRVADLLRPENL
jgi:guanylate kinase